MAKLFKVRVVNADEVVSNVKTVRERLLSASEKPLWDGALAIMFDSRILTPVITGNLRNSSFASAEPGNNYNEEGRLFQLPSPTANRSEYTRLQKFGRDHAQITAAHKARNRKASTGKSKIAKATIGYTIEYALAVHENPSAGSRTGQWKFLETAFKSNVGKIVNMFHKEYSSVIGRVRFR